MCDEEFLKEFPYFHKKIRVNETDKVKQRELKQREKFFDKILKQMGPKNDKCYVKYN